MSKNIREKSALFLEDFDIKGLSEQFPEYEVGVHINRIYLQIAKFNQNPLRENEIKILKKAVLITSNSKRVDSKYAIMKLQDVILCFGKKLNSLPKTTFTQVFVLENENNNID